MRDEIVWYRGRKWRALDRKCFDPGSPAKTKIRSFDGTLTFWAPDADVKRPKSKVQRKDTTPAQQFWRPPAACPTRYASDLEARRAIRLGLDEDAPADAVPERCERCHHWHLALRAMVRAVRG